MLEDNVFYGILGISWLEFAWTQYLMMRQRQVYRLTGTITENLTNVIDVETFNRAKLYNIAKSNFVAVRDWLNMLTFTAFICLNGITLAWEFSKWCLSVTQFRENEIMISCVFVLLLNGLSTAESSAINVYKSFVIKKQHGFDRQIQNEFTTTKTKRFWTRELSLQTILTISIIKSSGPFSTVWLYILNVMSMLIGTWIAPFSGTLNLLNDCPLKTKIKELADLVKLDLSEVYVSKDLPFLNTDSGNVYLFGLLNRKNVVLPNALFKVETRLGTMTEFNDSHLTVERIATEFEIARAENEKKFSDQEIVALVAREFGHWKKGHLIIQTIFFQIDLLIKIVALGWLHDSPLLFRAFGFRQSPRPVAVGLVILCQYALYPYYVVAWYARVALSAVLERQADEFAKSVGVGGALRGALIKLSNRRLSFPVEDGLYAAWCAGRPRLLDRLEALDAKTD